MEKSTWPVTGRPPNKGAAERLCPNNVEPARAAAMPE